MYNMNKKELNIFKNTVWSDLPNEVKRAEKDAATRKKVWEKYDKMSAKYWDGIKVGK